MNDEQMISISPNGPEVFRQFRGRIRGKNPKETEARSDYFNGVSGLIKGFSGDPEAFVKKLCEITETLKDRNMKIAALSYEMMNDLIGLVIDVLVEDEELHTTTVEYFNDVIVEEQSILDSTY